jgi:thiol-disulfide isomerase/thioredoxin
MSWAGYLVLSLVGLWLAMMIWTGLSARKVRGQLIDSLYPALPDLQQHADKAVVYCHSEHCGPCRKISPHIAQLRATHDNLFMLDISQHAKEARSMGIRAVPTTLLVEQGQVIKALLGAHALPAIKVFLGHR